MLTVILTILKIIGITLAVLIGLVLLIVLLVGFVPIRYKAAAKYPAEGDMNEEVVSRRKRDALMNKVRASSEEGDAEVYGDHKKEIPVKANAVVSWLLHLVHITVDFDSTGLIITARLLGLFKLYSNDPETVKKKEEKRKKKEEKARLKAEKNKKDEPEKDDTESKDDSENTGIIDGKSENEIVNNDDSDTSAENRCESGDVNDKNDKETTEKTSDSRKNRSSDKDEETDDQTDSEEDDESEDDSWWFDDEEESLESEPEEKGIAGKIKSIPQKIKSKIKGILEKIKGIKVKIRKLNKKKNYILDLKDDERVIRGIGYGKDKLFLIIKRILPKKLEGHVAFGMDDPATTGYIVGAASAFFPVWGPHFNLEPDFENKKIEADVNLKGRIILAMLVIPAVKIWFNKDIKYIRRKISKFKKL